MRNLHKLLIVLISVAFMASGAMAQISDASPKLIDQMEKNVQPVKPTLEQLKMMEKDAIMDGNQSGLQLMNSGKPGGASPYVVDDEIIRYDDGANNDAIGLTAGGTFTVAAYFPASTMGAYTGMKLAQMEIYINDLPVPCILKVYGQGTSTSPGDVLYEETVTPTAIAWNLFDLSEQIDITGDDLWIGYEVTHAAAEYPAGTDIGPHVPGGDWIETDGVWDELHILAATLDYNWNIAGYLVDGGPLLDNDIGIQTVSEPTSGVDLTDAEPVTVIIKNYGTETQSSFDVSFSLDGGSPVVESISTTLNGGDTYTHTFGTTVNLSTYGTYDIEACTDLTGDENLDNDCKMKMVENIAPSYCDATTGTEDEYIGNVLFGDIDNTTGWQGGVGDYTDMSTLMVPGGSEDIVVTNGGNPYAADAVSCWVDWNDDYEFELGGEEEFMLTSDGTGAVFTGAIVAPATAIGGEHRMRVRMVYSAVPDPCGASSYGEVEDYTILIGGSDFGHIVGNVMLDGIAPYDIGDVTEVAVSVGSNTVYPDASGNYDMEIYPGTYDVSATLYGYEVGMATDVVVLEGETVTEDFTLPCIYTIVNGTVTAANGGAPIEGATVVAEGTGISAVTMADGTYEIYIEAGMYDFTAGAPYYTYVTANLDLTAQTTTTQDFSLEDSEGVIVVIDLDPTPTGPALVPIIQGMFPDGLVEYTTTIDGYPLDGSVQTVFLLLGIYANNYVLTDPDAAVITTWMDAYPGGSIYMEGGDTWAYNTATPLHAYFNINGLADGSGDLVNANGIASYWAGNTWTYTGENNWIDRLEAIPPAVDVMDNPDVGYFTAVAYDEGTYKTVGASHEIMGLTGGAGTTMAVACVMAHFGYPVFVYGTLQGSVVENLSGDPIEGATITVGEGLASTMSGPDGSYIIEQVLVGEWDVTCTKDNYGPAMETVTIEEETTTNLNFALVGPGDLAGVVTDANSGDFIEGAMIDVGEGMYTALTLADGSYMIEGILAGVYDVTCSIDGYSPVTEMDVHIDEGQTTTQDFELSAPEIVIDPMSITVEIEPNGMTDELVNISNPGASALDWNASVNVLTDNTDEVGDILLELNVSAAAAETQMLGGEWDGTYFWTTGAGSAADPNKLYKFDVDGNLLETYDQPAASAGWGVRDLAWDGTYLYGGNESQFYQIDPADGTFTLLFEQTWGTIRALAYVPSEDVFYTKSFGDPLQKFDIDGNMLESISVPEAASAYGAAYDDMNDMLYIFDQSGTAVEGTTFVEFDLNAGAATGVTYLVPLLTGSTEQIAGGAFFATDLIQGKAVLGGVTQGTPDDMLFAMELGEAFSWITIDPTAGSLDPMSDEDMTVHFDATDMLPGVYTAEIQFSTNPNVGSPVVSVTMNVIGLIPAINLMVGYDCTDIELEWEMPSGGDPDSWNVYRDGDLLENVSDMMFTDPMVMPDMEYSYTVTAVYGGDESQPTVPSVITVPVPDDLEPWDFEVSSGVPTSAFATLMWEIPEACVAPDSYSIYRDGVMIAEDVTENEYVDGPLENGVYPYYVVAVYYFGESEASNEDFATIFVGIEDYDASAFQIFPNPANELVNVKSELEITNIKMLNTTGQLVLDNEVNAMEYQINVSKFEVGTYFIKLETSEGVIVRKVTVQ